MGFISYREIPRESMPEVNVPFVSGPFFAYWRADYARTMARMIRATTLRPDRALAREDILVQAVRIGVRLDDPPGPQARRERGAQRPRRGPEVTRPAGGGAGRRRRPATRE